MPVMARNVVATSQPLASQAGLQMLARGGNAIDAALAAAITLTVVEPTMNGIGSDAFCILADTDGKLHGLNASGRSPAAWSPERYAGRTSMPTQGWDAVTVPGCVSAWVALSERFGQLEFADLFEPAIRYARHGWLVPPVVATSWARAVQTFSEQPDWGAAFLRDGRAPVAGEQFSFEDQAHTLELIAASKGEAFYRGELAEAIAAHAVATGGALTAQDLAAHEPEWVTPLQLDYRGQSLHEIPPNGQGITAQIALGILRHFDLGDLDPDGVDSLHLQIEAMKLAYADARRYVSDPKTRDIDFEQLLDDDYLRQRASHIDTARAQAHDAGTPGQGETVYLTAADADGRMVSFIQSNFAGFGSGIVVPGTGISLQNRGSGFTLEAGHPNQVGGGKRPYHTIIPAFVTQAGKPLISYGVMGGHMQPQGHAQMMTRIFDSGQNPQAALDAPRWRFDAGMDVAVEEQMPVATRDGLIQRGHQLQIEPPSAFGGGQIIYRLDDGYCAASEPRKDGQAVGY
ncbi:MAG: gamma-glutamyltransferase family protein [Gemmatimonadetes bacterium]|nr:gamma-glutamyltransferase family protein [Gemmatimonadota bacterium]MBT7862324.1 gamma-glutamyltransferase family protein [Gemmatimonadota bacterium]